MGVDILAWQQSYVSFENQVQEFNDKIKKTDLTDAEVSKIYDTVKKEVNRLNAFVDAAEKREEELENGYCCSPNRQSIWIITCINGASKACAIAGAILAFVKKDDVVAEGIGIGLFALGELLDAATTTYEAKLTLDYQERGELAKLNRQGVEHARVFKKFLKELKEIKAQEKVIMEEFRSQTKNPLSDHTIVDLKEDLKPKSLDTRIGTCLKKYEELPANYRHEEVYCRIISQLIQRLPPDDPLRIGLEELEPTSKSKSGDIKIMVDQSLPTRYLPAFEGAKSSSGDDESDAGKWVNEGVSKLKKETLQMGEPDPINPQLEYNRRVAFYKHLVAQRFNLQHNVAFFDTATGFRIDSRPVFTLISESEGTSSLSHATVRVSKIIGEDKRII